MAKKRVAGLIAKGLGLVAVVMVSTACWWLAHRPEVPSELKAAK